MTDVAAVGIAVETDGVDKGIKKLAELAQQGPKVEQSMAGISAESKKVAKSLADLGSGAGDGLKKTGDAAQKAATGIKASGTAAREAVTDTASLARAMASLTAEEEKHIRKLVEEANGLRMTRGEMEAYRAAQRGMSTGAQEIARAMGSRIDALKVEQKELAQASREADKYAKDMLRASASNSAAEKSFRALNTAANAVSAALSIIGVGFGAREIITQIDGYTKFTAQLKLATKGASDYSAAMASVQRISTDAQQGIGELGTLYARIANGTASLNLSQQKLSDITETVALSLKVSGATASEASSAMLQLSQAFASGVLRGEEFNSVNEAAPRLMKALADGLGVPVGALRKMAEAGQLTSAVLAESLPKALGKLREEAESVQTISGAFTVLKNNIMLMVGAQATASGATKGFASGINLLANNLDVLATVGGAVALVLGARFTASIASTGVAFAASTIQAARYQLTLASMAGVSTTAATGLLSLGGAARGVSAAMAFLGGPLGTILTVAGAATAAFYTFRDSSESLVKSIGGLNQPLEELKKKLDALPAEKQIVIKMAIQDEQKTAIKQSQKELDALIQSVAGLASIRMPSDQFEALINDLRDAGKEGGNLAPVLQRAAESGNISPSILQKWLEMASRLRDAQAAAKGAAAALQSAASNTSVPLVAAENALFLQRAKAALEASKGYKSQSERMAEVREVAKKLGGDLKALQDAQLGNSKEAKDLEERIKGVNEQLASMAKKGRDSSGAAAVKKEQSEYEKLISSIKLKILENEEELKYGRKLSEADKLRFLISEQGTKKLTQAHKQQAQAYLDELARGDKTIEALKEETAARAAWREERQRGVNAVFSSAQSLESENQQLRDEIALIGKTRQEQASILQMRRQQVIATKEAALAALQAKQSFDVFDTQMIEALQAQIKELKERNDLLGLKDVAVKSDEANKELKQKYEQTIQQVEDIFVQGFADMMNNGKSGWESFCKSLRTSFFTLVAKQIYKMLAEPFVINIVGNLLGFTGSAAAGAAGAAAAGGGMFSNLSSGLSGANALGLLGTFGGGMSAGFGGLMGSLGLSTTGATFGGAMSAGSIAIGSGNIMGGLGTFLGALGPIIGGLSLLFGGDIFGSLFGRKLKESGVEGTFGGDSGFEGRLFKYYKGGLFRSNKTTYEELPEEMRSALGNQFLAMDESIRAMAGAVGLGGEALDGFTAKIKVNLKGLSEEEATKKLQEEFQKIADQMGGLVLTTDEYTRAGETQLEALTRLSTSITLANEWFKAIGDTLYSVSLAGADMASELMDAFGGADKFAAATSNYYDKFYTDQEKVANQTRLLNEALKKLGVESMPTSRDALREYINGIDLSTEAGRKLYAAMIGLADSFDVVYTSAENIAAMKEDLNVQLLRAQGKDDEATKLERAKQLKELEKYKDPELVRMQVEVWNAEDKAKNDAAAKQAAEDMAAELVAAQKAAKDLAMKNLEAAVSREKEYWNQFSADAKDSLTKASSYFDLVTNAAKSLRDSVEDSASWSAAAGMVYIEQALDRARKGGGLSDLDATKSAIEAATGGLVMDNYATQAELDYDKKVLAGQLDELGGYAELAKSDAQKQIDLANAQIKRLDDTLTFWKEYGETQVDATLSVTDAVNALYKLLDPKEQERIRKEEAAKAGVGGGSAPGYTPTGGGSLGGTVAGSNRVTVVGLTADGRAIFSNGEIGQTPAGQTSYNSTGQMNSNGYSLAEFERFKTSGEFEWDPEKNQWRKRASFAIGTNYVPRDMTANIHQGERIIPAADNRALMAALNTQGGGNAELVQEVKALRAELQAINHNTGDIAISNRRLDANIEQVSEGGNGLRTVAMN
ncbi:tape measure protein [Comamonas koreensis]|uniref:tape measure protein n=1 Tax=Comamonas koreensis TaxID=160825 RepID=UPI0015FD7DC2|nr:tape measure protein [Comamonas koreensis]